MIRMRSILHLAPPSLLSTVAFVGIPAGLAAQTSLGSASSPVMLPAASRPPVSALKRPPMRFVENAGQWDSRVRFRAESGGLELLLTDDGCIARFAERLPADADKSADAAKSAAVRALEPRVRPDDRVVGAALAFHPPARRAHGTRARATRPGETNYLIGNDPSQWRRGIAAYDSVVYHDWLPGVDVRFLERDGIPTYDVLLAPGASPDSIAFEWEGADSLEVDADGHLVAKTKVGELRHLAPSTYEIGEAGAARARVALQGPRRWKGGICGHRPQPGAPTRDRSGDRLFHLCRRQLDSTPASALPTIRPATPT